MVGTHATPKQQYALGNDPQELARLDAQSQSIEYPTRMLLQAAGLSAGMRVLDLGTGLGHVARIAAELVGPRGSVVGLDQSVDALAVARHRAQQDGIANLTFEEGNVTTWRASEPFDAVVARLLLFHVIDPLAVVRHHLDNLRSGGTFAAVDFDLGGMRSEPAVAIVDDAMGWVKAAFQVVGAWPRIGARLGTLLDAAGLRHVGTFGIQPYLSAREGTGAALLAGIVRSLAPTIIRHGIATTEELDLDNLERRLAGEARKADAVILVPTVAGAWGRSS